MDNTEDYAHLYGKQMTPEQFEEFKKGLREDLHRIGSIDDEDQELVELSKLFARLNGHSFDAKA